MAQTSRFWDGTALGDATAAPYDAANEFAAVMRSVSGAGGIATNQGGVFRGELNELAVTGAATPVSINTGRAINQGTWYEQDASSTIAVASPAVSTRIDVIVLRKDWSAQTVRLVKILGTEGGAAPALVQIAGTTWDIPLANVSITTGGVITLTDRRQFLGDNYFANISSFAIGDLLYAGSSSALAKLADVAVGSVLVSGGAGVAPAWSANPVVTTMTVGLGAVGTPSFTFSGDLNTGFWSPAADTLAASTGGTERWRIDSAGLITITARIRSSSSGAANAVIYAVGNDSGLGMYSSAGGTLAFATADTLRMRIDSNGLVGINVAPSGFFLDVEATGANGAARFKGSSGNWSARTYGYAADGVSYGHIIVAGSNSADDAFRVQSRTGTDYFDVRGDGNITTRSMVPWANNTYSLGSPGNGYSDVYCVRGAFNGSIRALKRNIEKLSPQRALDAILGTDFVQYRFKPNGDDDFAAEWQHVGVIADDEEHTDELFTFADRTQVNPQTTAAISGAGVQALHEMIQALHDEVAALRAK